MKYVLVPIFSARRNPESNQKVDLSDQIRKFMELDSQGQYPAYFISFTEEQKIGINPRFKYGNPIGVYAYPLRYVSDSSGRLKIPFAGDRPFIHVLKLTVDYKAVLFDETYNKSSLTRDTKKLTALFNKHLPLVKENWPSTAAHIADLIGAYVEVSVNAEDFTSTVKYCTKLMLKKFKGAASGHPEIKRIWCYTHVLAYLLNSRSSKPVVTWNKLLRSLGYHVVVDSGVGFIHYAEPTQAVFLIRSAYQSVDMLSNKPTRTTVLDFSDKAVVQKAFGTRLVKYDANEIVIHGDVVYYDSVLLNWPKKITVEGNLRLNSCRLLNFSPVVTVTRDLELDNVNLTSLGQVTVGRNLLLDDTDIQQFQSIVVQGDVLGLFSTLVKSDKDNKIYSIYNLPTGLTVDNLRIKNNQKLTSLPQDLTVTKELLLDNLPNLRELPKNLRAHRLSLSQLPAIRSLPDTVTADEIFLDNCSGITELSAACLSKLKAGLAIRYCNALKRLPDNLTIDGDLFLLSNSNLERLPDNLHVVYNLTVLNTAITELPSTLIVEGRVIVKRGTRVADGAKIGKLVFD